MTLEGLTPRSLMFSKHDEIFFPSSPHSEFQLMPQTFKAPHPHPSLGKHTLELRPSSSPLQLMECPKPHMRSMLLCQSGSLLPCLRSTQSIIKLWDHRTLLQRQASPLFIALLLRTADLSTEACVSQTWVRWMSWQPQPWSET